MTLRPMEVFRFGPSPTGMPPRPDRVLGPSPMSGRPIELSADGVACRCVERRGHVSPCTEFGTRHANRLDVWHSPICFRQRFDRSAGDEDAAAGAWGSVVCQPAISQRGVSRCVAYDRECQVLCQD